jgi:predicted amidohydrolase
MRVAAVQMAVTDDKDANLETADRLVDDAARQGGRLVVLPELFNLLGSAATLRAGAEDLDGPTLTWAAGAARHHGLWLVAGSITESIVGRDLTYNTSCVLSPDGTRVATYRKIHLFDNEVEGAAYRESASVAPGDEIVSVALGADEPRLGLTVCYDLRFPELYRALALAGAQVVTLPSAFMAKTGVDHWEPLIRARAIENQVYVIAPDQIGRVNSTLSLHGHSMIVDPWGTAVAAASDGECVLVADVDLDRLRDLRARLPSLAHRRPDLY